jgi:hypothetical protein
MLLRCVETDADANAGVWASHNLTCLSVPDPASFCTTCDGYDSTMSMSMGISVRVCRFILYINECNLSIYASKMECAHAKKHH